MVPKFLTFLKDVKAEVGKVTWSSRQEVVITTVVVFVIALVASLFFALVDTGWYRVIHAIIGR
ncbi:MAG: preprotein translocase subunit SecE [Alphaproteobacteria bacterium]|nr:preprotein translocase subunit SecE [Alphaproteobacteria bacterium]